MYTARFSETLASTDQSTRHLNPKEYHHHILYLVMNAKFKYLIKDKNKQQQFISKGDQTLWAN
jgi:hypothetical protein